MSKKGTIVSSQIIKLYEEGYSCKDICRIYNISALSVRNCLRAAGFNTHAYRKVSKANKDKIVLLVKAGYPYNQIENLLQVSTHLIREVVEEEGMIGFAPKYHHPIVLDIAESEISVSNIDKLEELYVSGKHGLAKCAELAEVSDKEFLWFVYHLSNEDKNKHNKLLRSTVKKMMNNDIPLTAIAKKLDVSPSIVKKICR